MITPIQRQTIKDQVQAIAQEFVANGVAEDAYSINCGYCQDLAVKVILGLEPGLRGAEVWSDDLLVFSEDEDGPRVMAWDRISHNWADIALPEGISREEMDTIATDYNFGAGAHVWAEVEGLHYDAEAPDGVSNPLELPFFKRTFEHFLSNRSDPGIAPAL